jgi:hypothetical protein
MKGKNVSFDISLKTFEVGYILSLIETVFQN